MTLGRLNHVPEHGGCAARSQCCNCLSVGTLSQSQGTMYCLDELCQEFKVLHKYLMSLFGLEEVILQHFMLSALIIFYSLFSLQPAFETWKVGKQRGKAILVECEFLRIKDSCARGPQTVKPEIFLVTR